MGNAKLPDALKAMRGTLKKSRSNPRAPKPGPVAIGLPPDRLRLDEQEAWARLAAVVGPLRVVASCDMEAFELLALAVALAHRTARDRRASANQKIRTSQAALSALREFGLTPSTRSKVAAAPEVVVDNLAEFLYVPGASGN